jgi:hypothetical protein
MPISDPILRAIAISFFDRPIAFAGLLRTAIIAAPESLDHRD